MKTAKTLVKARELVGQDFILLDDKTRTEIRYSASGLGEIGFGKQTNTFVWLETVFGTLILRKDEKVRVRRPEPARCERWSAQTKTYCHLRGTHEVHEFENSSGIVKSL